MTVKIDFNFNSLTIFNRINLVLLLTVVHIYITRYFLSNSGRFLDYFSYAKHLLHLFSFDYFIRIFSLEIL